MRGDTRGAVSAGVADARTCCGDAAARARGDLRALGDSHITAPAPVKRPDAGDTRPAVGCVCAGAGDVWPPGAARASARLSSGRSKCIAVAASGAGRVRTAGSGEAIHLSFLSS